MSRNLVILLLFTFLFPTTLPAEKENVIAGLRIEIPSKLRYRDFFVKMKYYGIIQSQKELNKVWSKLYDVYSKNNVLANTNDAPVPQVDFSKNSVIWYADRGSGASFVKSIDVYEEAESITITFGLFYSDFGSSHLNLWKVPRISKIVILKET